MEFARQAGVHIYVETGDRLWHQRGLLALHASFPGERTISLPEPAMVTDVRTGRQVAADADRFGLTLARGQTAVLRLAAGA